MRAGARTVLVNARGGRCSRKSRLCASGGAARRCAASRCAAPGALVRLCDRKKSIRRPFGRRQRRGVVPPGSGRRRVQTTNARAYATLNARKRTRANRTRTVNFRALPCPRSPIIHSLAGFDCAIHHHHRTSPARPRAPAHKRGPVALGPGDDDELLNKNPPTPCLWQASASTQKTKRKTRPAIRRSARWRVRRGASHLRRRAPAHY